MDNGLQQYSSETAQREPTMVRNDTRPIAKIRAALGQDTADFFLVQYR